MVGLLLIAISTPAESRTRKKFKVSSYGRDAASIACLVADVNRNKGGRIKFPQNETFVLSIKDDPNGGHTLMPQEESVLFLFKNCKFLDIDLNGSTIVLSSNHSSKYAVFLFANCDYFTLKNGTVVGDAKCHDYSNVEFKGKADVSSHEWGHGVMIMGSNGTISDLIIKYLTGDGIYISSLKESGKVVGTNVFINNCDIAYCRRNGIASASTTGFHLADTRIRCIGSYGGLEGVSPMAGIDFEYEDKLWKKGDITIIGCVISDCERKTLSSSDSFPPSASSFLVVDCKFRGSPFQIANLVADKGKIIRNCEFDDASFNSGDAVYEGCRIVMGPHLYYVHGTQFKHCVFEGTLQGLSGPYGCALAGNSLEEATFEGCTFRNIRGMNNSSAAYQGLSGYNFPLVANFKDCVFHNVSFVKGNPKVGSSFCFERCTLTDGCMIYNEGGNAIVFSRSTVDNVGSYQTQTGEFIFVDCEIIQDDETVTNPLMYFGTHRVKNCRIRNTLSIATKMNAKGIKSIIIKEE